MSKDQKIKIAMTVCAVVLLCTVILTTTGIFGTGGFGGYANAEKYTSGATEITGEVKNLEIHWTSGRVAVAYHTENTVTLEENASRTLSDDEKLQWWLDGETLRVQFCKPGIRLNMPGKELTITLPEGIVLENASIQTTSGDMEIPVLKAKNLELGATSGDINAAAETEKAAIGGTSGDLMIRLSGETESITLGTTSGNISLEAEKARNITASSTSGGIGITVKDNESTTAGSTSGNLYLMLEKTDRLEANSTSGSITAALPETPGFTAEVHTTSGSITCEPAVSKNGNRYVFGDGSGQVKIGTTSGNIRIEAAK